MRLDVAVGVLAHTLPLVAESSLMSISHGRKRRENSFQPVNAPRSGHHEAKPQARNADRNVLLETKPRGKQDDANDKSVSETSKPPNENATECNPRSNNPDVGIFSCGTGNHCIQDDDSGLGGFCVAYEQAQKHAMMHRSLQDGGLCTDPYLECDCDGFENGVGTYVCASSGECVDEDETICGEQENVVMVSADGSYRTSTCFVDTDGSPIQSYCYSTVFDGVQKTDCELEFNGVMCSSCSHVVCSDEFGGGEGLEFDCSNASLDEKAVGSTCDGGDWKDFFLDPSNDGGATPPLSVESSTPAPLEPPAPGSDPPSESALVSMQPSLAGAVETEMPSVEPTAEATSGGAHLASSVPLVFSVAIAAVLLSASGLALDAA